ncbi:variable surface protein [Plasmodium gonderi]|uniref:Variable surface protein n=1 Tax=Plasmodium gonderi TaxID=77519 RepID=A0A1Y1JTM7_PLAGO|nr:variable surface protein [Plasmodium gonderi]GAW84477.1 variable surface protein [Plasmodium gonderi]
MVTKHLSYKDVFPICRELYYNILYKGINKGIKSKLETDCNNFNRTHRQNGFPDYNLATNCLDLDLYLYKIVDYSEHVRKPYCNFFIYALKQLVRKKDPKYIERFDQLHDKMINEYNNVSVTGLGVCKEYVLKMNDDIYKIFEMFDELYGYFKYFQKDSNNCSYIKIDYRRNNACVRSIIRRYSISSDVDKHGCFIFCNINNYIHRV